VILRVLAASILLSGLTSSLFADGGTLQFRETSGPFVISLFTAPSALRSGPIDFSVLVQDANGLNPVTTAEVEIIATNANGVLVSKAALRDNAQNKLLYAASLTLPEAGVWQYTVRLRQGDFSSKLSGNLQIGDAQPRLLAHWREWLFIPLFVTFFVFHQSLKRNQHRV
jgi:hypothetical protein